MEREILFRGKLFDGEWIEGVPVSNDNITCIFKLTDGVSELKGFQVNPSTVGQCTGLTDKNGVEIFEEDILKRGSHKYVVKWCDDCAMFVLPCITDKKLESDFTVFYGYDFEIIGNVHDNPEMLKGED